MALLSPDGIVTPLDPLRKYTIVTNDYMLQGGDGYGPAFAGVDVLLPFGPRLSDLAIEDVQRFPDGVRVRAVQCSGLRCGGGAFVDPTC